MSEKINYQRILIPIDGTTKSIESFKYALNFALNFRDCEAHVIYVVDEEHIEKVSSHGKETYGELVNRYQKQGRNYINKAIQNAKDVRYKSSLIKSKVLKGNPVEEIVEYAKDFDLIIMAARGKKHVIDIMMGHVTERVINLTDKPVLITH